MTTMASLPPTTLRPDWRAAVLAPAARVVSASERLHGRLLAAVALVWVFLSLFGAALSYFAGPAPVGPLLAVVLVPATLGHLAAYATCRLGFTRLALAIQLVVLGAVAVSIQTVIGAFDEATGLTLAGWFAVSLVTVAAFVSPRELTLVAVAFGALFVATMVGGGAGVEAATNPTLLFGSTAFVLVVVRRHHVRLEAIHHRTLVERNAELEALRAELEDRVARRTRALTATNRELSRANESLRDNQRALISAEKMAAVGRLTAGIAHEMASPLSAVLAAGHELRTLVAEYDASIDDPAVGPADHREIAAELKEVADLVETGAQRATDFVRGIRAQTRDDGTRASEPFDCLVVAHDAVALMGHAARAAQCRVVVDGPTRPIELYGPASRLAQVITNLVQNAIDATGEQGGGEVRVLLADHADGVTIDVLDEGPGIPPEILPRIFEPLFTTKPYGKGTGLGLVITKEAVEGDFGGRVTVANNQGSGARVSIELPRRRVEESHGA